MFVGIDVSKNTLDAALLQAQEQKSKPRHKVFANTAAGHAQLLAWLQDNGVEMAHAPRSGRPLLLASAHRLLHKIIK